MLDLPPISQQPIRQPVFANVEYQQPPLFPPQSPAEQTGFFELEYPEPVPQNLEKSLEALPDQTERETEDPEESDVEEVEVAELYSSVEMIGLMTELRDQISSEINDMRMQGYRTKVSVKMIQDFLSKLQ